MIFKRVFVFGILRGVVKLIGKFIYKILSLLNLQFTLIICIIGLLLEIAFGTIQKSQTNFIIFHLIVVLSIVYALVKTVYKIVGGDSKKDRKKQKQENINASPLIDEEVKEKEYKEEIKEEEPYYRKENKRIKKEVPKYFRAKQNKDYVFAEYSDRYELYKENNNGLKYIRTDYKNK